MAEMTLIARALAFASILGASGLVDAATIYGLIRRNNQPVSNVSVTLNCAGTEARANTDRGGSYRLTVNRTGRCTFQVGDSNAQVILYDNPTRYDFEIRSDGGKASLINQ